MTTAKKTGLGAYSAKTTQATEAATKAAADNPNRVRRGVGDKNKGLVALTVRLTKPDWIKIKNLAMTEGETLQTFAIQGMNLLLKSKGQSPLEGSKD